jgi:hypothetical protein
MDKRPVLWRHQCPDPKEFIISKKTILLRFGNELYPFHGVSIQLAILNG